jgi:hypothetical protein
MIYAPSAIAEVCARALTAVNNTTSGPTPRFRKIGEVPDQLRVLRFMACDASYDPTDASKVKVALGAFEFAGTLDVNEAPLLDGAFTCGDSPFAFKVPKTPVLGGSLGLFVVRHRRAEEHTGRVEEITASAREIVSFVEDHVETAMFAFMSAVRRVDSERHQDLCRMLELVNRYALGYGSAFTATRLREMGCTFVLGAQSWTDGKAMFATTLSNAVVFFAVSSPEALCKVFEAKDHLDVVVHGLKAYADLLEETLETVRDNGLTYVDIASVAAFAPVQAAELAVPLRMATSSESDAHTEEPAPKRVRAGSVPPVPLAPCKEPSTPQQRRGSGRQLTF